MEKILKSPDFQKPHLYKKSPLKVTTFLESKKLFISKKCVQKQVTLLLQKEKVTCDELIVHFVNEKTITKLHEEFFADPTPTDTISFPIDLPNGNSSYKILGEVFICIPVAIKYALKHKIDPYDEALRYLIHSILHLVEYDDIDSNDKKRMRKKEKQYMDLFKQQKMGLHPNQYQ